MLEYQIKMLAQFIIYFFEVDLFVNFEVFLINFYRQENQKNNKTVNPISPLPPL